MGKGSVTSREFLYDKKSPGGEVIEFIERCCFIPEGRLVGQKVKLTGWQQREICRIYNNAQPTRRAILSFGRKNAKALALDTMIPTPSGWTTMAALRIGDQLFDERGQVCRVIAKSPIFVNRQCYRLHFADGSSIVADADHLWLTRHNYRPWDQSRRINGSGNGGRRRDDVVTTANIAISYLKPNKPFREHNHHIRVASAIQCDEVDLPISPYVLGYWLGNGNSRGSTVWMGLHDEQEVVRELEHELQFSLRRFQYRVGSAPGYRLSTGRSHVDRINSIQVKLRQLNVIGDKHIPDLYLWASQDQRLALLQGLMDSDGSCGKDSPHMSGCYYNSMNEQLAKDVLQLIRSLGFKASMRQTIAKIGKRVIGPAWSIYFYASYEDKVFRLPRKLNRLRPRPGHLTRSCWNAIVGCEKVKSVPTVCIAVDSPSRLFLAGEGFVPTHNTTLAAFLLLSHLCGPRFKRNSQLFSAAQSRDQAAIIFGLAAKIVRMSPILRGAVTIRDTHKELLCPELGTHYRALSAEVTTAFGLSPSFIVHDELGQVRGPRSPLYEALETATAAQDEPLSLVISTQAATDNDLLSILIDDAQAGHDPRTVVKLYSAKPDCNPFTLDAIKAANPAFNDFMNKDEVLAMMENARRMPSRESEYRNLVLNQRVESVAPFVSRSVWSQNAGGDVHDLHNVDVYCGLDLSSVSDLTAFVMIGRVNQVWHVKPTFWLPAEGLREKSAKDRVPYDLWAQQGYLQTTPGNTVSYEYVASYLRGICNEHRIRKIGFDRWNMKHLKPWLLKAGFNEMYITDHFVEFGQGTQSMSPALRELEQIILDRNMCHGNHPVLAMCAANATVEGKDDANRKLSKNKSSGRIDGMVALAMAVGVAPLIQNIDISALIA